MTPNEGTRKKYYISVILLFFAYLIIIPIILYILEPERLANEIANDIILFMLKVSGISLVISLIISSWIKSDPEFEE